MHTSSTSRFGDRNTPPHILTLVLVTGISALSMTVIQPSLPGLAVYFRADYTVVQLAISAYLGVNALLQLFFGPISDRYGRRPVLLASMMIFLLATLGSLLATSIEMFLVFRMIQSVVVAGMVLGRAVVRDMVSADRAASMLGYVTMGTALVPMMGPLLGGVLEEWIGWKANFTMLLIAGGLILALLWVDLGETNTAKSGSFRQQFQGYPELFSSRRFWGYAFAAAFSSGAFFSLLGGGPFVADSFFNLSPAQIGAYFAITPTGYMAGNFLTGRYSTRYGINRMMLVGGLVLSGGMLISLSLLLSGATHPLALFGLTVFVGLGNGLVLPNANAGMLSVRPHLAGTASGLGGALMTGGGAAFAAITGAVLTVESGPYPLVVMMLGAAIASVLATGFVIHVARTTGPLEAEF
jgi:MFS transporter, DHA1 family, multidrug resistance protein